MQTTGPEEELVEMEEEILLHDSIPLSPTRPLSFDNITLDDVSIVGIDSTNQSTNFSDASLIYSPEKYFTVAETAARSLTHLTLNELGKRLLLASRNGNSEDVKLLMAKGAPFTCDWLGTSALHLAAQNNNQETVEILLRAGISRDSRTKVDKTALHLAAAAGNAVIVEMLLAHGSDVNACDMLRMTPLHWAVDREHKDVIKVLLEHGANPNIISKFDKTVFSIALDNSRPDLLTYIQSIKPLPTARSVQEAARERDAATLAATHSITNELAQVPAVSQQEEVETSATDPGKVFDSDYLEDEIPEEAATSPGSAAVNIDLSNIEDFSTSNDNTIKYLQAHGITMLPAEEARPTLTEVAMESGGKVVLTEAGKLAMNLTEENASNNVTKPRRILIRKQIILANNLPKGPNILKRTDEIVQKVALPCETTLVAKLTEANSRLDAGNKKLCEAQRMAKEALMAKNEALKLKNEAQQEAKNLKAENEQLRIMLKSLKRKHPVE